MPRVLIVDDHQDVRYIVREILKRMGCDAVEAGNGVEALAVLEQDTRFDLILTDLRMAPMDGFQLLDQVMARAFGIPVVMMSVHTAPSQMQEAVRRGADGYLAKPFNSRQLMAVAQRYIEVASV